jgi:hypothetical protein
MRPGEEGRFRKLYPGECRPRRFRLRLVRVLGEERDFVAVGFTFAVIAFEGGGANEPMRLFEYQVAAALTFEGEIDVPQSS